jgi:hypothetical protein
MEQNPSKVWRYFSRNDGFTTYGIYRIPANGLPFIQQRHEDVERLERDGTWIYDPADNTLWHGSMNGEFSETDDEISEEEVRRLFDEWSKTKWPGRAKHPMEKFTIAGRLLIVATIVVAGGLFYGNVMFINDNFPAGHYPIPFILIPVFIGSAIFYGVIYFILRRIGVRIFNGSDHDKAA